MKRPYEAPTVRDLSETQWRHLVRPRLCRAYCNSQRAGGVAGPLCPHCDACASAVQLWSRVLSTKAIQ